ncbi:MAG: phage holin family protein [Burkholderiales bacterium]|nr:phage holin family protein [Burkholderiales bacterium]
MRNILRFLAFWAVNTLVLWIASELLSSIRVDRWQTLLLAGLCFGIVNTFLKPVLFILTLPITVLTLGLFVLVLNTLILFVVAWIVPGFHVGSFWQTFFAALVISILSFVLNLLFGIGSRSSRR